jgi:hypothetical protein
MGTKLSFGSEPNMKEVPLGQHAMFTLQSIDTWGIKDTEYGEKYCLGVNLLSHPSYESIPKQGLKIDWLSKCNSAKLVFFWVYDEKHWLEEEELKVKPFDFDLAKELDKKWKLRRFDTGSYMMEQI